MKGIYDTPKAVLDKPEEIAIETKLFKVSGIVLATFLGSILAGGLLMALNYTRMGLVQEAKKTFALTTIAATTLFTIIFMLPENIPNSAFYIPQVIAMHQLAKKYQGEHIAEHISSGGRVTSNWIAFGLSLFVILFIVIIVFVGVFFGLV